MHAQPEVKPGRWSDLRLRVASALALLPVVLLSEWAGGWPWAVLVAFAAAGMAWEWSALFGGSVFRATGLLVLVAVVTATLAANAGLAGIALVGLGGGFLLAWMRGGLGVASGALCIGIACMALVWLRSDIVAGQANLLFLLFAVWASDIGAYAVGRILGGPKLAPAISPGKTWSGAIGGLSIAAVVGEIVGQLMHPSVPGAAAGVAALLAVAAQVGDLVESALKRHAGVKDSSRMIPGHGGLLDRLDGVLAATPAAAALAVWAGRGVFLWQ